MVFSGTPVFNQTTTIMLPSMQTHRVVQPLTQSTSPFLSLVELAYNPENQTFIRTEQLLGHRLHPADFQKLG